MAECVVASKGCSLVEHIQSLDSGSGSFVVVGVGFGRYGTLLGV